MIKAILNKLRQIKQGVATRAGFKRKYLDYLKNGFENQGSENQEFLRRSFILTKGKSIKWAYKIQEKKTKYKNSLKKSEFFPELNESFFVKAVNALRKDGFYILPWRMPKDWVEKATNQALHLPVESRSEPPDIQFPKTIKPKDPTYWHKDEDILKIPEFKQLIKDPGILEIIGRYLGCEPVFDLAGAWWTFPFGSADSKSAQLYHFDLDRIKWLKVFVYMTDVSLKNGPHAFIKGSHLNSGTFATHDGRYSDEEIFKLYPKSDEIIYEAPAGTVILEDTLGFHKGFPALEGHRFIFEYEYSINGFGYPYPVYQI